MSRHFPKVGWIAFGLALTSASPAFALDCQPYWTDAYKCLEGCGGCPVAGGQNQPGGPNPIWMMIGRALGVNHSPPPSNPGADPSAERAYELDELGVAADKAGNLAQAAEYYKQALMFMPNDSVIRRNLALAYNGLGMAALKSSDYANAVTWFQLALPYVPSGDPGYATVSENLAFAQAQLNDARSNQQAAARIRDVIQGYNDALPPGTSGASGGLGFSDFDGSGHGDAGHPAQGLGFDSFGGDTSVVDFRNAAPGQPLAPESGDPMVVDLTATPGLFATRVIDLKHVPSSLPKSVSDEIPHTPSGDQVRKAFVAIQFDDWVLAGAYFQKAEDLEPENAGLARLVDLSQFMQAKQAAATRANRGLTSEPIEVPSTNAVNPAQVHPPSPGHGAEHPAASDPTLDRALIQDAMANKQASSSGGATAGQTHRDLASVIQDYYRHGAPTAQDASKDPLPEAWQAPLRWLFPPRDRPSTVAAVRG